MRIVLSCDKYYVYNRFVRMTEYIRSQLNEATIAKFVGVFSHVFIFVKYPIDD